MNRKVLSIVFSFLLIILIWALIAFFATQENARYTISDLGEAQFNYWDQSVDINNNGDILLYHPQSDDTLGFCIRSSTGALEEIKTPFDLVPKFFPSGFNDRRQIVGTIVSATDNPLFSGGYVNAVLEPTGELVRIGKLGGTFGGPASINNHGQVAGIWSNNQSLFSGFIWSASTSVVVIPSGSSALDQQFSAINDLGEVVGHRSGGATAVPILRSVTGHTLELETLGYGYSVALGVNNRREVVGYSSIEIKVLYDLLTKLDVIVEKVSGTPRVARAYRNHAFLWANRIITDLNNLIPTNSDWKLIRAGDINDRGEIVGFGTLNKEVHMFLLTPIEAASE